MPTELRIPADLCLDHPLWHFAGRFWSGSTAQTTALGLQERGWSVTNILCALWLASQGRRFRPGLDGADGSQVVIWREQVTETLRQVRKAIVKGNPATDPARNCIARSELEAEKVELALAYRALSRDLATGGDATIGALPHQSTVQTLALENLQAAAPEKAMDNETGKLLDTLTKELQMFTERGQPSC